MTTEAEIITHNAFLAAAPAELDPGKMYGFRLGDRVHQIDLTGDQYRDAPRRKAGTTVVRDADSFVHYYGKHADHSSEVYADESTDSVTAVLDAHQADAPRFGEHRVRLQLEHSDAWQDWKACDGRLMPQTAFAEFLEEHRQDVHAPSAAELLEIVQTFHATSKVTFKSGTVLKSGQRQLTYAEETNATAGAKGNLTIPDTITLGLQVYRGASTADAVTARLRYRIDSDGRLSLGYKLDRPSEVKDAAFEAVITEVDNQIGEPILRGHPADRRY